MRALMAEQQVDVLLLSVGADLPYFCGYEAMALPRLTMLVVPQDGDARLIVPRLEAPRVVERPGVFEMAVWNETDDPIALARSFVGSASVIAVGDRMWAGFLVDLARLLPGAEFRRASEVTSSIRSVKDAAEVESLRAAAAAADRVAVALRSGDIELVGRTEAEVSAELGRRLLAEGHQRVNFAIVAAGENAASPHHEPGERTIKPGEVVLCDFGGTMANASGVGYCSDITRCVHLGEPPADLVDAYDVLFEAQAAQVAAAEVGRPCQDVDRVGREIITEAGFGDNFIHRTGHGIGTEAHEDPYIVEGNTLELRAGHAFSIEPGIYLPGRWGLRLEDIVVAATDGPDNLTTTDHRLAVLDV
ncbi:MAG: aminopeptidase P family protein [Acidimicrobiia bacterium]|nr:aminopeptidase P family protein [Acidimicrobiia bacterium]MYE73687.1 aminopeptidase P family protein [Acidimicrobiia bacterium]MYJ61105.1 aminopeptidase P family protein [Acidimicrobiia bacterium]